eukprot:GHVN01088934.1.p1 GENE.GHVN01088934.1~~GHVN01088934.1.p1  ORF type:complete len:608 (-),score=95.96 GHVN01088934.1:324-2147(-)
MLNLAVSFDSLNVLPMEDASSWRRDLRGEVGDETAAQIVNDIRLQSYPSDRHDQILRYAKKFGEVGEGVSDLSNVVVLREELYQAYLSLNETTRECLSRVAARIQRFAEGQRGCLTDFRMPVPGGFAGHDLCPVDVVGCYAPGGRHSLPSTVMMTVIPAIVAGVGRVWVASPRPNNVTKAAAYISGAEALVPVGGAHAIAALAFGCGREGCEVIPNCDMVVGPGNVYVTAAKRIVSSDVGIDMTAGPSELVVVTDGIDIPPNVIASDLIAQAEHDPEAHVALVVIGDQREFAGYFTQEVNREIRSQLSCLPTRETATRALISKKSFLCFVDTEDEAVRLVDSLAPEHLEVVTQDSTSLAARFSHYGGLFIGGIAAEVLGDYGIGPNHTLPTSGTARRTGGLSVMTFLRVRTWVKIDSIEGVQGAVEDAMALADIEGLQGHKASAATRLSSQWKNGRHTQTGIFSRRSSEMGVNRVRGVESLIRSDADRLMQYHPVKPVEVLAEELKITTNEVIKLDANENLYGPHPSVPDAVAAAVASNGHIYPDPSQNAARKALSAYCDRPVNEIVCGAGADELIRLLISVVKPRAIVVPVPTFPMYKFFSLVEGG